MSTVGLDVEARARELVGQLTVAEKLRILAGDQDLYRDMMDFGGDHGRRVQTAAAVPRLGLRGLHFADGPRGVALGIATSFPVPMARAASFDYDLEERVGEAIAREARAQGADWVGAPCINLLRHPGWGRAQETYGENSEHTGEMGAAFVRGLQRHVLGCAKHFACNTIENRRFEVDVRVTPEVLERVYLPHFKRVVDEGVASIMSAYNSLNGEWCGQNRTLLTTILKESWGFDGFVVSDWVFGIRDGVKALNAGLDLEMPSPIFIDERVTNALESGAVSAARVDDAVLRLIRQQLRFETIGDDDYGPEVIACAAHRALAREAAAKGIVLLRNEPVDGRPVLPLAAPRGAAAPGAGVPSDAAPQPGAGAPARGAASRGGPAGCQAALRRLAVIGRLADSANTGDHGSSHVVAPYVVTPLQGLRAALEPLGVEVLHDDGSDPLRAADLSATTDAAIVVAGYDYRDEGEYMGEFPPPGFRGLLPRPPLRLLPKVLLTYLRMRLSPGGAAGGGLFGGGGDRTSLTLHPQEEELIRTVAAANPRTVAVLVCGSAVIMESWRQSVPAILVLWYAGMEGGHALADIVLGRARPTGRLPFAIPTSAEHLPPFDPWATVAEYEELHGQALLDHLGVPAAYPYGFGLNYSL